MTIDDPAVLVLAVLFTSGLVKSTFGFGDALVAMPLLSLFLPITTATPLVALIGTTNAVLIIARTWDHVDFRSALRLTLAALAGIPLGVWLLQSLDETVIKGVLAVLVLAFSGFGLLRPHLFRLETDRAAPWFGLCAGVLGGAYNVHGPPLVIFGLLRRWPALRFRATLQGYFIPAGSTVLAAHALGGFWTAEVFRYYGLGLPVALLALLIGRRLHESFETQRFNRLVHGLLLVIGGGLLVEVLGGR